MLAGAALGAVDIRIRLCLDIAVDAAAGHGVGELHAVADAEERSIRHCLVDQGVAAVARVIDRGQVGRQLPDQAACDAGSAGDD